MKKLIVSLCAVGLLAGPLSGLAGANPVQWIKENGVPKNGCDVQEMLGIVNVKECETTGP